MAQTASNVTAAKPVLGGAIYTAPKGTTAPTSADATLANAFVGLGYCSEDGLVNSNNISVKEIKAWGGQIVKSVQEEVKDTFKVTLIEALNPDVLKAVHGTTHVTGALATGLAVEVTADEKEECVWVCDMIMNGDTHKRIVLPNGKITEIGDVAYQDSEVVGYEITITAFPDTNGKTHYEYFKTIATT